MKGQCPVAGRTPRFQMNSHVPRSLNRLLAWAVIAILVAEIVCRAAGLGTPVLYVKTDYGYRVAPNQEIRRFGNRVSYNAESLRNGQVSPAPDPGVLRILCVGDSITNGGTVIDQTKTYPYQLESELRRSSILAEVLNASAPGWAPANELGWLTSNGVMGSRVVVLEIATHDLFQPKAESATIDRHPSFPGKSPPFGLYELFSRYIGPRINGATRETDPGVALADHIMPAARNNLLTIGEMIRYVRLKGALPVVLLIEQPPPLEPVQPVFLEAKRQMEAYLAHQGVPLVRPAGTAGAGWTQALFRDGLHPNVQGNRLIAMALARAVAAEVGSSL